MLKIGGDVEYVAFNGGRKVRADRFVDNKEGAVGCDGCGRPLEIRPTPQPATPDGVRHLVDEQRTLLRSAAVKFGVNIGGGGYVSGESCGLHVHLDCPPRLSQSFGDTAFKRMLDNVVGSAALVLEGSLDAPRRGRSWDSWRWQPHGIEYRVPASPPTRDHCLALYALSAVVARLNWRNIRRGGAKSMFRNSGTLSWPRPVAFNGMQASPVRTKRELIQNVLYFFDKFSDDVAPYEDCLGSVLQAVDSINVKDGGGYSWWPTGVSRTRDIVLTTMRHWGLPYQTTSAGLLYRNNIVDSLGYRAEPATAAVVENVTRWLGQNRLLLKRNMWIYTIRIRPDGSNRPMVAVDGVMREMPNQRRLTVDGAGVELHARYDAVPRGAISVGLRDDIKEDTEKCVRIVKGLVRRLNLAVPPETQTRAARRQRNPHPDFGSLPTVAYPKLGDVMLAATRSYDLSADAAQPQRATTHAQVDSRDESAAPIRCPRCGTGCLETETGRQHIHVPHQHNFLCTSCGSNFVAPFIDSHTGSGRMEYGRRYRRV